MFTHFGAVHLRRAPRPPSPPGRYLAVQRRARATRQRHRAESTLPWLIGAAVLAALLILAVRWLTS